MMSASVRTSSCAASGALLGVRVEVVLEGCESSPARIAALPDRMHPDRYARASPARDSAAAARYRGAALAVRRSCSVDAGAAGERPGAA